MAIAAVLWDNLLDDGTWTASSQLALAPVSRLKNKHVARKWRANASAASIVCDRGANADFNVFALIGLNVGTQPTRVRVSTADASGAAGDGYDSGVLSSPWNSKYLPFVHLPGLVVTGRYVRFDFVSTASYIECGRGVGGEYSSFDQNFAEGWSRVIVDPSIRTVGRGGQAFDDLRPKYRVVDLTFQYITEDTRWNVVEEIDLLLGQTGDMLVMTNPESADLSRDSLWGFNQTVNPVIEPTIIPGSTRFQKQYSIRERL